MCTPAGARFAAGIALAAGLLHAPEARAGESGPTHGAGSVELRLQTATNIAIGGQPTYAAAPGFAYDLDDKQILVNVVGGAAYFVTSGFALGLDSSYTRFPDRSRVTTLAPFVKLVSGFERWRLGAFVELSPGLLFTDVDADQTTYLQLSAWGGFHVPITDSAALVIGPSVTTLVGLNESGEENVLFGTRAGLNVYLSPNAPPEAARPLLGRRTFELRFQTGTHAAAGGVLSPQASHSGLYSTRESLFWFNAIGGGGIFLTDAFAFGGEFSSTQVSDPSSRDIAHLFGMAGYAKLVSGMASWTPGAFVELSPGLFALSLRDGSSQRAKISAVSQLALWAGAHLPMGTSTALTVGPSITRFDDLEDFDHGVFLVGARLGVSLYLPSKRRAP